MENPQDPGRLQTVSSVPVELQSHGEQPPLASTITDHNGLHAEILEEATSLARLQFLLTLLHSLSPASSSGTARRRGSEDFGSRHASASSSAETVPGNLGNYETVQDRIKSALRNLQIFYQFWTPVPIGGQSFLTTSDQPCWLNSFDENLHLYREKSSAHNYSIDIQKKNQLGPPGRVFIYGSPEFSPNVKYYATKEYHLRDCALSCGVKNYCALPVFDKRRECVGVLEFLPNTFGDGIWNTINLVSVALETVDLASSYAGCANCSNLREVDTDGLVSIKRLLNVLRNMHNFPIARAWVPNTCEHWEDELWMVAFDYNRDDAEEICSFNRNCTYLQEAKGLVGKAFSSSKSCFCSDITRFSITDYPFVHYARECKLTSCFAIYLPSIDPRFGNYILELFLAPEGRYSGDPQAVLQSLLATMAQHLQNFKVAAGQEEQGEKLLFEAHLCSSWDNVDYFDISKSKGTSNENFEASENERDQAQLHSSKEVENIKTSYVGGRRKRVNVTNSKREGRIELEGKREDVGDEITLELLKQQFGKKRADAAGQFKVSITTLKRRCREFGIPRWPSHKRTKVDSVDEERVRDYPAGLPKSIVVPEKGTSAMQDKNTMIIKATYGDHTIKFPLSFSSGIEDLKREIAKRLEVERYIIKYKDEEDVWILIACNDDLHYCMQSQKVSGKTSIQLLVIEK